MNAKGSDSALVTFVVPVANLVPAKVFSGLNCCHPGSHPLVKRPLGNGETHSPAVDTSRRYAWPGPSRSFCMAMYLQECYGVSLDHGGPASWSRCIIKFSVNTQSSLSRVSCSIFTSFLLAWLKVWFNLLLQLHLPSRSPFSCTLCLSHIFVLFVPDIQSLFMNEILYKC